YRAPSGAAPSAYSRGPRRRDGTGRVDARMSEPSRQVDPLPDSLYAAQVGDGRGARRPRPDGRGPGAGALTARPLQAGSIYDPVGRAEKGAARRERRAGAANEVRGELAEHRSSGLEPLPSPMLALAVRPTEPVFAVSSRLDAGHALKRTVGPGTVNPGKPSAGLR